MQWREGGYRGNAVIAYYMIGPIGVKGTQVAFLKMIYILWKFILLGRRAFMGRRAFLGRRALGSSKAFFFLNSA